jgi:hypothetical protein
MTPSRGGDTALHHALGLCWGAWAELGVSGWGRTHRRWAMDPEPLLILTARLGDSDPRLRDETLDWAIHFNRYVSRVRLRNLLRRIDLPTDDEDRFDHWGEFAATVNARAGVQWPHATAERAAYRVTGRSRLRSLDEASLVALRMKAMFGLSARTEILRHLLLQNHGRVSVAGLATATGYAKRVVAEECQALELAGVLSVSVLANRFYYSLAKRSALGEFVGATPPVCPDWTSLARLVLHLVAFERTAASLSRPAGDVEARRVIRGIEPDLELLDLSGPQQSRGPGLAEAVQAWSDAILRVLAAGRWPGAREGT